MRVIMGSYYASAQSRTQSLQAIWPAVGRQERMGSLGIGNVITAVFLQAVTEQPIKKIK